MTPQNSCRWFVLLACLASTVLCFGPCPKNGKLKTYRVKVNKWGGDMYVNIVNKQGDNRCQWISRRIGYENNDITLVEYQKFGQTGQETRSETEWKPDGKGRYKFTKETSPGKKTEFRAFVLHYDPPNLVCQLVCTDDPSFSGGQYEFSCDGKHPDAVQGKSKIIRQITQKVGMDLKSLFLVDNCKCTTIPYLRKKSRCKKGVTIEKFFKLKPQNKPNEKTPIKKKYFFFF